MHLRIISGLYGNRTIQALDNGVTHPMSERVRGSLFNIIGEEINNAKVLDTFAGSGSLGLEAISRGAKNSTFVERDKRAKQLLIENIKSIGVEDKTTVFGMGVSAYIDDNSEKMYDVIFTDPPYNDMQLSTVSRLGKLLSPTGLMVLSYPGRGEVPTVDGIVVVDNRSYGNAALAFYRKK